jgi:hypothetical protein
MVRLCAVVTVTLCWSAAGQCEDDGCAYAGSALLQSRGQAADQVAAAALQEDVAAGSVEGRHQMKASAGHVVGKHQPVIQDTSSSEVPPGTVYYDGIRSFELKRTSVDEFPAEIYYKFPSSYFREVNDTHAYIPFHELMWGTFVRRYNALESYEFGAASLYWNPNTFSMFPDPTLKVAAAEKLHTLHHLGKWSTESEDRSKNVQAQRDPATQAVAEQSRFTKAAAVMQWATVAKTVRSLLTASIDPHVVGDLHAFALGPESESFNRRMTATRESLTQELGQYKQSRAESTAPSAESTANNCHHLAAAPGLRADADGFWLPLGQTIVSYRGQIVFAPLQRYSLMSGITRAVRNVVDDTIEIYMGASSFANFVDPEVPPSDKFRHEPNFFVAPADASNRPVPPEGRQSPPPINNAVAQWAYSMMKAIPDDYTWLFQNPHKLCNPGYLAHVQRSLQALNTMGYVQGSLTNAETAQFLQTIIASVDCSADYLRADSANSHAFGLFEQIGAVHGAMEFGIAVTNRGWNDIPASLFE